MPRDTFIHSSKKQLPPSMAEAMILPSAFTDEGDFPHGFK
jgi:hypothetical protein